MRIDPAEYRRLDLRAHALLADAPLHDVWAIDLPGGGPDRRVVDVRALFGLGATNPATRGLFAMRRAIGRALGWDREPAGVPTASLLHALAAEDRAASEVEPGTQVGPFRVLYVFAREALSDGIALGTEAERLIEKYEIDPAEANGSSSDESCDLQHAKRIVSCVWYVATCKEGDGDGCPEKNYCEGESQTQERARDEVRCQQQKEGRKLLTQWTAGAGHVITPDQPVCDEDGVYRRVMNDYLSGVRETLRDAVDADQCRVLTAAQLVKVVRKSADGKLLRVEYVIPYTDTISEGWAGRQSLMTREKWQKEWKKSRF